MDEVRINNIIKQNNIPQHVAIIMDGNGRWAKSRNLPRVAGHNEGIKSVRSVVKLSRKLNIKILTLYTFSSENWRRPKKEVSALMRLLVKTINNEVEELDSQNVQIRAIGNLSDLPDGPRKSIKNAIEKTKDNSGLILNLALSYSSRNEIIYAVKNIIKQYIEKPGNVEGIGEKELSENLYTSGLKDPDLLIRTSGEHRISNFLLWQIAYSEIYFSNTLWPDFREDEFLKAVENYQNRERRFGKTSEQL
ncbi:isoprenyl transferase [candidate division KSB1 bacterium]